MIKHTVKYIVKDSSSASILDAVGNSIFMRALQLLQSLVFHLSQNKHDPLSYEEASNTREPHQLV